MPKETNDSYDLQPEYRFDYTQAKPNRFAKRSSAPDSLPKTEQEAEATTVADGRKWAKERLTARVRCAG